MFVLPSCEATDDNGTTDEPLTEEETTELLLAEIDASFEAIVSNEWVYSGFEPSDEMTSASQTADGLVALTTITRAESAKPFLPSVKFSVESGVVTPTVVFGYDEADEADLLYAYEIADFGFDMGFYMGPDEYNLAQICRTVASGFASDDLGVDDIADETTGELIFTFSQNDLSEMDYDDVVLNQRVLIKGNNDKIYVDEDGSLVVEVTSTEYGVSKYRYTLAE